MKFSSRPIGVFIRPVLKCNQAVKFLRIFRYMYILYSHYGQENDIFERKFTNVYTGICKYSS